MQRIIENNYQITIKQKFIIKLLWIIATNLIKIN